MADSHDNNTKDKKGLERPTFRQRIGALLKRGQNEEAAENLAQDTPKQTTEQNSLINAQKKQDNLFKDSETNQAKVRMAHEDRPRIDREYLGQKQEEVQDYQKQKFGGVKKDSGSKLNEVEEKLGSIPEQTKKSFEQTGKQQTTLFAATKPQRGQNSQLDAISKAVPSTALDSKSKVGKIRQAREKHTSLLDRYLPLEKQAGARDQKIIRPVTKSRALNLDYFEIGPDSHENSNLLRAEFKDWPDEALSNLMTNVVFQRLEGYPVQTWLKNEGFSDENVRIIGVVSRKVLEHLGFSVADLPNLRMNGDQLTQELIESEKDYKEQLLKFKADADGSYSKFEEAIKNRWGQLKPKKGEDSEERGVVPAQIISQPGLIIPVPKSNGAEDYVEDDPGWAEEDYGSDSVELEPTESLDESGYSQIADNNDLDVDRHQQPNESYDLSSLNYSESAEVGDGEYYDEEGGGQERRKGTLEQVKDEAVNQGKRTIRNKTLKWAKNKLGWGKPPVEVGAGAGGGTSTTATTAATAEAAASGAGAGAGGAGAGVAGTDAAAAGTAASSTAGASGGAATATSATAGTAAGTAGGAAGTGAGAAAGGTAPAWVPIVIIVVVVLILIFLILFFIMTYYRWKSLKAVENMQRSQAQEELSTPISLSISPSTTQVNNPAGGSFANLVTYTVNISERSELFSDIEIVGVKASQDYQCTEGTSNCPQSGHDNTGDFLEIVEGGAGTYSIDTAILHTEEANWRNYRDFAVIQNLEISTQANSGTGSAAVSTAATASGQLAENQKCVEGEFKFLLSVWDLPGFLWFITNDLVKKTEEVMAVWDLPDCSELGIEVDFSYATDYGQTTTGAVTETGSIDLSQAIRDYTANGAPVSDPTISQICQAFAAYGPDVAAEAVAIARAESGLQASAQNQNNDKYRSCDYGLFQINNYWNNPNRSSTTIYTPCGSDPEFQAEMLNASQNIARAVQIYRDGGNTFQAWKGQIDSGSNTRTQVGRGNLFNNINICNNNGVVDYNPQGNCGLNGQIVNGQCTYR